MSIYFYFTVIGMDASAVAPEVVNICDDDDDDIDDVMQCRHSESNSRHNSFTIDSILGQQNAADDVGEVVQGSTTRYRLDEGSNPWISATDCCLLSSRAHPTSPQSPPPASPPFPLPATSFGNNTSGDTQRMESELFSNGNRLDSPDVLEPGRQQYQGVLQSSWTAKKLHPSPQHLHHSRQYLGHHHHCTSGGAGHRRGKRIRTIFTAEQLKRLEEQFERQQYMVGTER